ncbi:hypothetical protein A3F06_02815 [candidate division TM6 bacterium RIFCSPHIGHO2_12_FULL_36_22]|nr:MAG: hypothetical protein A3F06_02815 [candidate division TM6 bacterium RIFCSPHIGHO2_12_FULL_36_22]
MKYYYIMLGLSLVSVIFANDDSVVPEEEEIMIIRIRGRQVPELARRPLQDDYMMVPIIKEESETDSLVPEIVRLLGMRQILDN